MTPPRQKLPKQLLRPLQSLPSSRSGQRFFFLRQAKRKTKLAERKSIKLDHLMDLVGELVTGESTAASNPDLRGLKLDNFTNPSGNCES